MPLVIPSNFDIDAFDRLLGLKIGQAEVVSELGDAFLAEFVVKAPVRPKPWYRLRDIKSRNRILAKVVRYQSEDSGLGLAGAIDKVTDYAGGRLLVYFIDDVAGLQDHLRATVESRDDVICEGACDDRTHNAKPSGFRGAQQVLKFQVSPGTWFPFELQTLTFLQHDWDQKHHGIYEDPESFPQNIKSVFTRLSENLYHADIAFQRIRPMLESFTTEAGPPAS